MKAHWKKIAFGVFIFLFVLQSLFTVPGHCVYEVRDIQAREVMAKIARIAGWQVQILPEINSGPTHQQIFASGLGFMYIDRPEVEKNIIFSESAAPGLPSGNMASYGVWNPQSWADWGVEQFHQAGFTDAKIAYTGPNKSLYAIKCPSALGQGAVVFRLYSPLMVIYGQ